MITIRLDGDPVAKGRPRFNRATGVAYTPAKTASYENRLAWAAQVEMKGRPLLEGALALWMSIHVQVPKTKLRVWKASGERLRPTTKPDWDNFAKIIDALNKIVWVDDSQVVQAHIAKFYSERPRIEIFVSPA